MYISIKIEFLSYVTMFKSDMFCVGCPNGLLAAAEAGVREEDRADWQDGRVGPEEEEENLKGTLEQEGNGPLDLRRQGL